MALTKAIIEILDRDTIDPQRGLFPRIPVEFDPTQCSLTEGAQIAGVAIPGVEPTTLQFIEGQTETLALELFFDTTTVAGLDETARDVRTLTKPILHLAKVQPRTSAPPRIRFRWGNFSFEGIIESTKQKLTLLSPLGTPLRATVSVGFRGHQ